MCLLWLITQPGGYLYQVVRHYWSNTQSVSRNAPALVEYPKWRICVSSTMSALAEYSNQRETVSRIMPAISVIPAPNMAPIFLRLRLDIEGPLAVIISLMITTKTFLQQMKQIICSQELIIQWSHLPNQDKSP
jgi:hypothetical protein